MSFLEFWENISFRKKYPKSQQVTYKYYVGRKHMFDYDFKEAEQYLTFAFEHCHKSSKANKRQILTYLIPVKMLLGHMPNQAVLEKYDLMQFNEVVQAVKQGNLLRFDTSFQGLSTDKDILGSPKGMFKYNALMKRMRFSD